MARKKKTWNLKSRITSALRKIWFYGPQRREAAKTAKDRGNTCALCNEPKDKLEIDHIKPVVPLTGFDNDWNNYIARLFVEADQLRALCKDCHSAHTTVQRQIRKKKLDKKTKK